jgi:hypothetical protein
MAKDDMIYKITIEVEEEKIRDALHDWRVTLHWNEMLDEFVERLQEEFLNDLDSKMDDVAADMAADYEFEDRDG